MARVGIVFGIVLCCLSIVGMVGTLEKYPTQFIPMMLGVPVLFCGVVALNPHRRRYAMHAALMIAFVGAVCGGSRASYDMLQLVSGDEVNQYAFRLLSLMSVICAIFVVICLVSFFQTSRRKAAAMGPTVHSGHHH
jgi:hypothetical protein